MRVLICGGGVIGASIAYFLSLREVEAIVVERHALAGAASGKAGGFLARDWCDGTPLAPLARRSFTLHAEFAAKLVGDWGYRRLYTYGGVAGSRRQIRHHGNGYDIGWLSPGVRVEQHLGSPETTAQVHPAAFTAAMMRAAEARGAVLRIGQVTGIVRQPDGRVSGVELEGGTIAADAVVIAMGPWSVLAAAWLPLPAVFGLKGHSLVFDTERQPPAEALFIEYRERTGMVQSPELFPRPDCTTYVCAISSESPLPLDPADVIPDPGAIERLEAICNDLSPCLAAAQVRARQACYRPIARDGLPLIGRVPATENAYVATAHGVWGILNAPATGEAIAELITAGRARSVDLSPYDPARLPPLDPPRLRRGASP
jgi:glycine/D-amino acid oxidase-like deaminating enzyme